MPDKSGKEHRRQEGKREGRRERGKEEAAERTSLSVTELRHWLLLLLLLLPAVAAAAGGSGECGERTLSTPVSRVLACRLANGCASSSV